MPRFTLDADDDFNALLNELAQKGGGTKASVIRDAVSSYAFLRKESQAADRKVSITDDQDNVIKDVILPG